MQCVLLSRLYQIKKIDKKLKPLPPTANLSTHTISNMELKYNNNMCMHASVCVCVRACMHASCMHVCMYVCMNVVYVCMYVCM